MTSPFADASVEVIADFDRFDDDFSRRLHTAVAKGAANVSRAMNDMHLSVGRMLGSLARLGVQFVFFIGKAALMATALAAVSAAAAAATLQAVALAGALLPIGGLVAALPAALAGAAAGVAVLKLAMSGLKEVATALGAGDLDAFNKALGNLSPNAQKFAQELRILKPHLDSLRFGVQDRVFDGMSGALGEMTANLLPTLRRGLGGLADVVNVVARQVMAFLSTSGARSQLATILESARVSAVNLGRAVQPVVEAFLGMSVAGGPAIERITAGISRAATRFAEWVTNAQETGRIKEILDNAFTAAKQFGGVLADVAGILRTVFSSASESGGDLLGDLKAITGAVRDFLSAGEGKSGLNEVFGAIRASGQPILDLLGQIAAIIGTTVAPIFGQLAQAVGPGLAVLVKGIGDGLASLAPIAAPVGAAFSELAAALGPVAAVGGQLVVSVLGPLALALAQILPVLSPVVAALGGVLVGAVNALLPPFLSLVTAVVGFLPGVVAFGQALLSAVAPAFAAMQPALDVLVPALGALVVALAVGLAPILPGLSASLVAAFGPISAHAGAFTDLLAAVLPLVPALALLLPPLVDMVPMFAALVATLAEGLVPVLEVVVAPLVSLAGLFGRYPALIQGVVLGLLAWTAATKVWAAVQAVKAWWMATELALTEASAAMTVRGTLATVGMVAVTYTRIAAEKLWTAAQVASGAVGQFLLGIATGQIIRDGALTAWTYAKTAATWLWTAAQSGAAIAAGVWTGVQWALNVALNANPIGLIVLAIAALVGGIILAYQHSETFRNIVDAVGRGFVTAAKWIADAAVVVWGWLRKAFDLTPLGMFIKYFSEIRAAFFAATAWMGEFFGAVGGWIGEFVMWWSAIPGRVWTALLGLVDTVLGIRQRILDALTSAKDWLLGIGGTIMDGLIDGVKGKIADLLKTVKGIAKALPDWVRETLGIESPSKVMYEVGADAGKGFANGISKQDAAVRASALKLKIALQEELGAAPAMAHQVNDPNPYGVSKYVAPYLVHQPNDPNPYGKSTYVETQLDRDRKALAAFEKVAAGEAPKIKKALDGAGLGGMAGKGMVSKEAKDAADALATELEKRRDGVIAAGKFLGDGFIAGLTGTNAQVKSAADKMSGLLVTALGKSGARPVIAAMDADSRLLRSMADRRVAVTKDLAAAQKGLDDLVKKSDKLRDSIAEKVRGAFELIPATGTRSVAALLASMRRAVAQADQFSKNIQALRARGLAASLLSELAEAGPEKGGAMAARLAAATTGQLGQLNTMSGTLERAAVAAGTSVSNAMYASGIAASRGLVAGLTSRRTEIESAMLSIAKGMAGSIRKALGIRSPSAVMRDVGVQAGLGLQLGLLSQVEPLRRTMSTVGAVVGGDLSTAGGVVRGAAIPGQRVGAAGPRVGQIVNNIHMPTGDPGAAAQAVLNRVAAHI